ncbi:Brca1-a complex subunit bre-like [Plakobranchus ocellatus]|uniref:BRISC and BRCA1-A complex member 2 n=1 Tax=Plakobranchus ocellatus TaxID=259542 RepID=A0AAV3ZIZ6_9GAST|nr:Brca1-a complex subunit bre-like [Plakobranchus ocellatus]
MVPDGKDELKKFDFLIRPYLDCLLSRTNDEINLTSDAVRVTDCCSGCLYSNPKDPQKCDRFTLKIPYAQQILSWQVIFNASDMKEPPDFIFDAEDYDFHPPLAEINSLVCWDWQNRESLVAVITELLEHYQAYQLDRASSSPTLQRHLKSLIAQRPQHLQLIVNRGERSLGTLNCLMRVDADFSKIPPYLVQGNPGQDGATLHICIPYPESSSIQAQLYLSPSVECALGGSSKLRIPGFQHGLLMGDYFSNVKALLENQVRNQRLLMGDYFSNVKSLFENQVRNQRLLMGDYFSNVKALLENQVRNQRLLMGDYFSNVKALFENQVRNQRLLMGDYFSNVKALLENQVRNQRLLMGDYFSNLKALLENQVKLISEGFEKRKDYLAAFISHYGKSVLEYDMQSFTKITLLWEWNDFFFTFTVELPLYFPSDQPTFILKSVYHCQNKRPYMEKFSDFPYSPRWSGNEMVKRASAFVLAKIKDFQMASVNHSDK